MKIETELNQVSLLTLMHLHNRLGIQSQSKTQSILTDVATESGVSRIEFSVNWTFWNKEQTAAKLFDCRILRSKMPLEIQSQCCVWRVWQCTNNCSNFLDNEVLLFIRGDQRSELTLLWGNQQMELPRSQLHKHIGEDASRLQVVGLDNAVLYKPIVPNDRWVELSGDDHGRRIH